MPSRTAVRSLIVFAAAGAVAASAWLLLPVADAPAKEATDFEKLQITFAPNGVTFFDERTGDVWIHPYQITGAVGVSHFRVAERGATLTAVPEKK